MRSPRKKKPIEFSEKDAKEFSELLRTFVPNTLDMERALADVETQVKSVCRTIKGDPARKEAALQGFRRFAEDVRAGRAWQDFFEPPHLQEYDDVCESS